MSEGTSALCGHCNEHFLDENSNCPFCREQELNTLRTQNEELSKRIEKGQDTYCKAMERIKELSKEIEGLKEEYNSMKA